MLSCCFRDFMTHISVCVCVFYLFSPAIMKNRWLKRDQSTRGIYKVIRLQSKVARAPWGIVVSIWHGIERLLVWIPTLSHTRCTVYCSPLPLSHRWVEDRHICAIFKERISLWAHQRLWSPPLDSPAVSYRQFLLFSRFFLLGLVIIYTYCVYISHFNLN